MNLQRVQIPNVKCFRSGILDDRATWFESMYVCHSCALLELSTNLRFNSGCPLTENQGTFAMFTPFGGLFRRLDMGTKLQLWIITMAGREE